MKKIEFKNPKQAYRDDRLLQIAMPLGGIGAGCISLNGYGGLQDFSIRHAPVLAAMPDRHMPLDSGFALLHLPEADQTRLVEGPFPPEKIYNQGLKSQGYNGTGCEGFPRFRDCSFLGEYPLGRVELSDPDMPVSVNLTAFNPFIPLDEVNSGIPCLILEYELVNNTDKKIPYDFVYNLSHLAQKGVEIFARSEPIPGMGVYYWNEAPDSLPGYGSAALGVLTGNPVIKARWFRGHWFDAPSILWREISTGTFKASEGVPSGSKPALNGGSVLVSGQLEAGGRVTIPVVISWYFPNFPSALLTNNPSTQVTEDQPLCHPFYSTQWKDAREVLDYVREHYQSLRDRTVAFHDALFASTLPVEVLEAVSANLAVIKSPTVLRFDNGDLWGWEGCFCDKGSCPGSCTHVWNYAQSIPHLFPALERTLRQRELEESMDERGHINFRSTPPGVKITHDFHAAADGQLGGIMKVYREWLICGDRAWLERMYPLAKRSLDFCIQQWDPRHTGLIEEPHHNTYDIEFWGPDGLCSSFYIGALTAISLMAKETGHFDDCRVYDDLLQKAVQQIEKRLFNGKYYEQQVMSDGLNDVSFVQMIKSLEGDQSPEAELLRAEGPRYQVGKGCLSDGVFGAWMANLCGISTLQDKVSIRSHLSAVYRYNFKPSLWNHVNPQRPGYAIGDEAGLLLCSWPRGERPTLPFIYSDEVWTGIEYQVASHLISQGMEREGLTLVKATRARYNGRARNPWNEYECGNYYARAMASYALLFAYSGFRYEAPKRELHLDVKIEAEPFTCFFSTASGWGTFTLQHQMLEICLTEGDLDIENLMFTSKGQIRTKRVAMKVKAATTTIISLSGDK